MPPSPALRCSPGKDPKLERRHKRGHSFDSGLSLKAKDDDLILFNEMQKKESDNFLLHSNEDFDDTLSKLKCFSDIKLGIKIPARGEKNDLLNANEGKNDYDWLLTPPDTPLFPFLDDDEPRPANLVTRGRQSQPVSITKLPTTEKNQRPKRTNSSPHRRSPSPRPGGTALQSRGRASSVPHSTHTPVLRPSTPSRRPSTPTKPSTPTQRTITPTLKKTSSGLTLSSGRRGNSPIKGSRGNSASPKLGAWQSNVLGFSSDAPPNLRTSVSDRPTSSYSRGSSPASRNSKEFQSRHNRQSMSPTASRSASSSHSHENDRLSFHSKGSIVSSANDDISSIQSSNKGISVTPTGRKNGSFANRGTMAVSKKTSRTSSPSSAPKRSFDSALRQMDHRKTPQKMFRPLMSSVPPSSFYGGKESILHRPIFSRHSSLTTSSNTSSEQSASVAPETDYNYIDHAELTSEWKKAVMQEELFHFEKMEIKEDTKDECCIEQSSIDSSIGKGTQSIFNSGAIESICDPGEALSPSASRGHVLADSWKKTTTCSICRKTFQTAEKLSGNADICVECAVKNELFSATMEKCRQASYQEEEAQSKSADATGSSFGDLQSNSEVFETLQETDSKEDILSQQTSKVGRPQQDHVVQLSMGQKEESTDKQSDQKQKVDSSRLLRESKFQHSQSFSPSSQRSAEMADDADGTGMSVYLRRANSSKGPSAQGKLFPASNIHCADHFYNGESLCAIRLDNSSSSSMASSSFDFGRSKESVLHERAFTASRIQCTDKSYARGKLSTTRLGNSHNSSTTSSLDLGSSRQSERHFQQQQCREDGSADCIKNERLKNQTSLVSPNCSNSVEIDLQNHENGGHSNDVVISRDFVEEPCCRTLECIDRSDVTSSSIETVGTVENSYSKSSSIMDARISESSDFSKSSHAVDSSLADIQASASSNTHDDSESNETKERSVVEKEEMVDIAVNTGKESETCTIDSKTYKRAGVTYDVPSSSIETVGSEENNYTKSSNIMDAHLSESSDSFRSSHTVDSSLADSQASASSSMHDYSNAKETKERCAVEEDEMVGTAATTGKDSESCIIDDKTYKSSGVTELGTHDILDSLENLQLDCETLPDSNCDVEEPSRSSVLLITDEDRLISQSEPKHDNHADDVYDTSTVIVENSKGIKSRSLTLEEATDTILFCSSIVHDLASKAAATASEKEHSPVPDPEVPRPTITSLDKPVSFENNQNKRLTRRANRSQKTKKKPLETVDVLSNESVNNVKVEEFYNSEHPPKHSEYSEHPPKHKNAKTPKIEPKCHCTVM